LLVGDGARTRLDRARIGMEAIDRSNAGHGSEDRGGTTEDG
jgi:hypothetical protein